jgi:hypothetical protein
MIAILFHIQQAPDTEIGLRVDYTEMSYVAPQLFQPNVEI